MYLDHYNENNEFDEIHLNLNCDKKFETITEIAKRFKLRLGIGCNCRFIYIRISENDINEINNFVSYLANNYYIEDDEAYVNIPFSVTYFCILYLGEEQRMHVCRICFRNVVETNIDVDSCCVEESKVCDICTHRGECVYLPAGVYRIPPEILHK